MGLAYGLADVEALSILLLGPTGRGVADGSWRNWSLRSAAGLQTLWGECGRNGVRGIECGIGYFLFRHSHGAKGCGSAHKPFFASRDAFSSLSSFVFPGAFIRYHLVDSGTCCTTDEVPHGPMPVPGVLIDPLRASN